VALRRFAVDSGAEVTLLNCAAPNATIMQPKKANDSAHRRGVAQDGAAVDRPGWELVWSEIGVGHRVTSRSGGGRFPEIVREKDECSLI